MKTNSILRFILSMLMMVFTIGASAQTNGDKLFMQGQNLQKTQTVAAQNQAIKKFRAAKIVYTTADKKKMCDNQISICNNNIASLKRPATKSSTRSRSKTSTKHVEEPKAVTFVLGDEKVSFDGDKAGSYNVAVVAPSRDWDFTLSSGVDGEDNFATVKRGDDGESLDISVPANTSTLLRHQSLHVSFGDLDKTVSISQAGKAVTLSASENLLDFKAKGGSKSIEIYTNSDSTIADKNNVTWYVASKPDWIDTNVEVQKDKSVFGKGISALKGLVKGSATAASAEDAKTYNVRITAQALKKGSPDFVSGRKGEVVFASQDKTYTVEVTQEGK